MTDFPEEQVSLFGPDIWSGKTSPAPLVQETPKERTSPRSSKKSSKSRSREPLCVCVCRTEDGQNPGAITLTMVPGALLGGFTTHSFGESPREENASRLSQILEDSAHPKYSLSARACEGILRRAERRGKELPEELKKALEVQSAWARGIGYQEEVAPTLASEAGGDSVPAVVELSCGNPWDSQSERVYHGDGAWHSLNANSGGGQNRDAVLAFTQNQRDEVRDLKDVAGSLAAEPGMKQQTYVFENHSQDSRNNPMGEICETVSAKYGTGGNNQPLVVWSQQGFGDYKQSDVASSCKMRDYKDSTELIAAVDCLNGTENPETNGTLQAKESGGTSVNYQNTCRIGSVVRRLTPMECERLQGYPDGWTDIGDWTDSKGKKRKAADGPRYKALGNSIALPFWQYLARRICAQYERDITLGSLFDGIGGFPYVFERCGAKAVWASEIEEFAIAVTKNRFPEKTEEA